MQDYYLDEDTDQNIEFVNNAIDNMSTREINALFRELIETGKIRSLPENTCFDNKVGAISDYFFWNVDELGARLCS